MFFDTSNKIIANKARIYLEGLIRKEAKVEIAQKRKTRSGFQNRYLHQVLGDLGQFLGYEVEEIKTLAKRHCGLVYEKQGQKFLRSTADLDTKEFCEFVRRLQQWAAEEFDYTIPDPI